METNTKPEMVMAMGNREETLKKVDEEVDSKVTKKEFVMSKVM